MIFTLSVNFVTRSNRYFGEGARHAIFYPGLTNQPLNYELVEYLLNIQTFLSIFGKLLALCQVSALRRLERVFSRTRARKHTRQLNDSKLAHRKLILA